MKITFKNKTYNFTIHKIQNTIHFESPITGELIEIPNKLLDYTPLILKQHIAKYSK